METERFIAEVDSMCRGERESGCYELMETFTIGFFVNIQ